MIFTSGSRLGPYRPLPDYTLKPPAPWTWFWVAPFALLLAWPALWNGFPLFFYDSIDYIASSFSFTPAVYRTLPYSLFVRVTHGGVSLWGTVAAQALLLAYLIVEVLRVCGAVSRARLMSMILFSVGLGTGLPWFASQIMPDLFTGAMVAGLGLLGVAPLPLHRRLLVAGLTLTAIAAHASHFPTALAVWGGLALLFLWDRRRPEPGLRVRVALPLVITISGILVTPAMHRITTGEFFVSRSAPIMALARLIRDGEAQRYLAEVCPSKPFRLCAYQDELPTGWNAANDFLWGRESAFAKLGGWDAWREIGEESRAIVAGAWMTNPGANLAAALRTWVQQLVTFGSGSGLGGWVWGVAPLQPTVERHFPAAREALSASVQYRTDLEIPGWSRLHQVVLSLAMLAAVILLLFPRRRDGAWALLLLVAVASLVNSGVTAIFSNPDDRYQARLVWLFVPLVLARMEGKDDMRSF